MKKYIVRALKYYVFLLVLIALVILLLALVGFADLSNIHTLFRNGYTAVWEIALIFLAVALIYPKLGFGNRDFNMRARNWDEARTNMMIALGDRGYKLETENGNTFTFRKKWFVNKLAKFLEDRITITVLANPDAPDEQTGTAQGCATDDRNGGATAGADPSASAASIDDTQTVQSAGTAALNRYAVNIEGLTKDVLRIVSALYKTQNQNNAE